MRKEADKTEKREKTVVLAVSISAGDCGNGKGSSAIDALVKAIENEFPDYEVRRAYAGRCVPKKLTASGEAETDRAEESVERVLEKAALDGIANLIIQPLYLMEGYKYADLAKLLEEHRGKFRKTALGRPLLSEDGDFAAVVKGITEKTADYDDKATAICFVGHGTAVDSNAVYQKMQEMLQSAGYENYYIGTIKANPAPGDVAAMLKKKGTYKRVVLAPFMMTTGSHARNDIAGNKTDSWKSVLEKEGFEVNYIPEGLEKISAVRELWVEHIRQANDVKLVEMK